MSPALTWIRRWACLRPDAELMPRINQEMLASEIGFGHHIQWIDFLFHPDGTRPGTGNMRSRRTVVNGRICATGASIECLTS